MSPIHLSLGLGILLGASGTWLATRPRPAASDLPSAHHPQPATFSLPPWSWRDSATPAPLPSGDVAAAISAWFGLRSPDGSPATFAARADALRALLARLPSDEFPRVLARLATPANEEERRYLQGAFDTWVERDAAAAARWAEQIAGSPGSETLHLAVQAGLEWARHDALAAAAWASSLSDKSHAQSLARDLLPILAEKDPAIAVKTFAPRLWNNGEGYWALRETIAAWVAREPSAAIAWLLAQPRSDDAELGNVLGNLGVGGGANSAAIATALVSAAEFPNRQSAIGQLLFSWSTTNPDEALAWLNSLDDRHLRTALLERAARITSVEHPERSLPLALAMSEGINRNQRLTDLLGRWAKNDPSATLAWIREHDDPAVTNASARVQAAILGTIARDEPATAVAEWNTLADGPTKDAAKAPIAEAWGRTDPAAALQWLNNQEPALFHYGVADRLVFSWARKDPEAALRWAETRPGNLRANYLAALAGTWQDKAPRADTADLYAQIKDPALRTQFVTTHVAEWMTKDPAAAKAWLESHDALTPAQAAALLAPAK